MKWIEASERLPNENTVVHFNYKGIPKVGKYESTRDCFSVDRDLYKIQYCEWLDESPSPDPLAVNGWISVEKGLPEFYQNVLIHYNDRSTGTVAHRISDEEKTGLSEVYEKKFDKGTWWDGADLFHPINDVAHWMPLPAPPKQVNEK